MGEIRELATLPQSGVLERSSSGGYTILLNANESPQRQLFTLAHELGHIWIPSQHGEARELEKRCDVFAAELLMPEVAFIAAYRSVAPRGPAAAALSLSLQFGVSVEAGLLRFNDLDLFRNVSQWVVLAQQVEGGWRGLSAAYDRARYKLAGSGGVRDFGWAPSDSTLRRIRSSRASVLEVRTLHVPLPARAGRTGVDVGDFALDFISLSRHCERLLIGGSLARWRADRVPKQAEWSAIDDVTLAE